MSRNRNVFKFNPLKLRVHTQKMEIKCLRRALNAATRKNGNRRITMAGILTDKESQEEKQEDDEALEPNSYADNASAQKSSHPLWDDNDKTYRCTSCAWEVVDGMCQACLQRFGPYGRKSNYSDEMHYRSVSTDNKFIRSDRQVHPRGSTPLGFVDPSRVMPANVPHAYTERQKEYRALLARGATKFMCETFLLEFTPDTGIIAWADEGLFKEFSRPAMEVGDKWKIHLGRRIELSEEDADGAMFIEELLEEAVYFPSGSNSRWITHEEEPGLWVTSPNATVITEEDFDEDKDEIDCDENGFSFSSLWDQTMPVEEESTGGNEPDDEIPDASSDASFDSGYAVEISNQIPEAIRPNAYESDDDGGPDTDQFEVEVPDEAITAAIEDDAYWSEISMESEDIEDEAEEDEDEVMA